MNKRRAVKNTNLRDEWRAMAGHAALAFDAFDHGAFFTADICTRTASQIDVTFGNHARVFQRFDLAPQDLKHSRVFVAHVDKAGFRFDRPSGDQHAFKEKMWCAFKVVAVFERTRFPFIAIDRQIAGASVSANKAPFLARWETSAAQTAQTATQSVVLFIHGYNYGFTRACRMAAELQRTLSGKAVVVRDGKQQTVTLVSGAEVSDSSEQRRREREILTGRLQRELTRLERRIEEIRRELEALRDEPAESRRPR